MLTRNKNIKIILNYVVGPLVFCLLLLSIYRQIRKQPDWEDSIRQIRLAIEHAPPEWMAGALLLLFLNWGLEARKWQLSISRMQPIGFGRAFRAVFTGTTLAFFTPNRMGEYVGRILYIEHGKRLKAISLTLVCSMAQLLVTLVAGAIGLLFLRPLILDRSAGSPGAVFWLDALFYISAAAAVFLTLLYFRLGWLVRLLKRIPRIDRFTRYISVIARFDGWVLGRILLLSFLRYLVFLIQYYLLFRIFQVELNLWQVYWSVSVVFLVLALIPSIAVLTELGIRWKASIEVIQLFSSNTIGILAASLAIWIINLVIPALIGSLLILNIRLFRGHGEETEQAGVPLKDQIV